VYEQQTILVEYFYSMCALVENLPEEKTSQTTQATQSQGALIVMFCQI